MAYAPIVFTDIQLWIEKRTQLQKQHRSIGFVPTMGALHAGHLSLIERSKRENDVTVLSIYVNPTQFDNKEDLAKYPVTFEKDRSLAHQAGVDFILAPTYEQMYPDNYTYKIVETAFSKTLCGAHRPGHFDGMLSVVMKLLNITQSSRAYFGEKDYQQLQLVREMVKTYFVDTQIVGCPTLRESDGLAMSSRNVRLTPEGRAKAPQLVAALHDSVTAKEAIARLKLEGFEIEYVEDIEKRRFAAVKLDGVRLIDNVER